MKICIVTGGSGFLGYEICKYFSNKNYKVYNLDLNLPKKNKSKNIINKKVDITSHIEVKQFFKSLEKKKINVLINNAAIDAVPYRKKNKTNEFIFQKKWINEFNVGIYGSYLMIFNYFEKMSRYKTGSIINIGSDLSVISPDQKIYKKKFLNYKKPVSYSVIKHGLVGLTKYFATEFASSGINVNMVSPAPINNPKNLIKSEIKKIIPSKKLIDVKEILKILFFLSENNVSNFTGQNVIVDGGRTII